MRNHDTLLAAAIIAAAIAWWAASAIGKWRNKRRLMRLIQDTPQVPPLLDVDKFEDSYIDTEFTRLTRELEPQPAPYDWKEKGI